MADGGTVDPGDIENDEIDPDAPEPADAPDDSSEDDADEGDEGPNDETEHDAPIGYPDGYVAPENDPAPVYNPDGDADSEDAQEG